MYAKIYTKMKLYQELAEAELLCLRIQQTYLADDICQINESQRNYIEYKNRAKLLEEILDFACKK